MSEPKKIWLFADSPPTGIAIGMFIAATVALPQGWFLIGTWVALCVAVFRTNFFERKSQCKPLQLVGSSVLSGMLGIAMLGLWHILPKPKDPPTSDEIVAAIKKAVAPTPEGNPARTSSPKRSIFAKSP